MFVHQTCNNLYYSCTLLLCLCVHLYIMHTLSYTLSLNTTLLCHALPYTLQNLRVNQIYEKKQQKEQEKERCVNMKVDVTQWQCLVLNFVGDIPHRSSSKCVIIL